MAKATYLAAVQSHASEVDWYPVLETAATGFPFDLDVIALYGLEPDQAPDVVLLAREVVLRGDDDLPSFRCPSMTLWFNQAGYVDIIEYSFPSGEQRLMVMDSEDGPLPSIEAALRDFLARAFPGGRPFEGIFDWHRQAEILESQIEVLVGHHDALEQAYMDLQHRHDAQADELGAALDEIAVLRGLNISLEAELKRRQGARPERVLSLSKMAGVAVTAIITATITTMGPPVVKHLLGDAQEAGAQATYVEQTCNVIVEGPSGVRVESSSVNIVGGPAAEIAGVVPDGGRRRDPAPTAGSRSRAVPRSQKRSASSPRTTSRITPSETPRVPIPKGWPAPTRQSPPAGKG